MKENDETEMELHAELWTRFAQLSLKEETIPMCKFSLKGVEAALALNKNAVPQTRLRWYSLAEHLFSETLMKMLNTDAQEVEVTSDFIIYSRRNTNCYFPRWSTPSPPASWGSPPPRPPWSSTPASKFGTFANVCKRPQKTGRN